MDNHYQPLSHALQPVQAQGYEHDDDDEHEEEEEEDDDEGVVESQLDERTREQQHAEDEAANANAHTNTGAAHTDTQMAPPSSSAQPEKRRPGRPRGSKNRKPRASGASAGTSAPPAKPWTGALPAGAHEHINPGNQAYYEFQWRVLNLCAEFYGAAEELVKGAPPLVIAQCYQMGPAIKVDPLVMLNDAKLVCNTLLANPQQLVSQPPPPMYPVLPQMTYMPPTFPAPRPAGAGAISTPQSFSVSLGAHQQQTQYAAGANAMPPPPPASYYGYPHYSGAPYGYAPAPTPTPAPTAPPAAPGQTQATAGSFASGANQGPWTNDEVERLRKYAEDSRKQATNGEIDWEYVVNQWGGTRTRHQILIKATSLGMKESSSRPNKRPRESESAAPEGSRATETPAPAPAPSATPAPAAAASSSPPSPSPSPQLSYPARPASNMPWPMPTVAANTPPISQSQSPVQPPPPPPKGGERTSYYRARAAYATATNGKKN